MEIAREIYLEKLKKSIGNGMAKVITGPRRCGKSYLLFTIFRNYLKQSGVDDDHIIELKLDDTRNASYRSALRFAEYFRNRRKEDGSRYFFLIDEIQYVLPIRNPDIPDQEITFYDALNEFLHYGDTEVFVTGSNSRLLSSDIATEFRGRGWQVDMRPLTFSEFLQTKDDKSNLLTLWDEYWRFGGLPDAVLAPDEESKIAYLRSTFNVIYLRDIIDRYHLRKDTAIGDVVKVLASSVGSPMSFNKIASTFQSAEKTTISPATVKLYVGYMEDAFLVSRAQPDTIKGRKFIGAPAKYYFDDLGIRYAATGFKGDDQEPHYMENIIYNELISRGYLVSTGKLNVNERSGGKQENRQYEIDFVCEKDGERIYIQSAFYIPDADKMAQEKKPLLLVRDSFRKVLISKYFSGATFDNDGILQIGLFDFLTKPDLLRR